MSEHWTTQDWLLIVRTLAVFDHWHDRDDATAERIAELQRQIAVDQGYDRASEFLRKVE